MTPAQNPNPAIKDITANIGSFRNVISIETPYHGCWRVCINGKPASDWCNRADAENHARRLGWRPDGKRAAPASLQGNERGRLAANEILSLGPRVGFAR